MAKDHLYRELCEDCQKTWKQRNPDYMKQYRAIQREAKLGQPALRPAVRELERLLSHVKNTLVKNAAAVHVKRCAPGFWLVSPKGLATDKNTPTPMQVIMIQGITPADAGKDAKELRSGNRGKTGV